MKLVVKNSHLWRDVLYLSVQIHAHAARPADAPATCASQPRTSRLTRVRRRTTFPARGPTITPRRPRRAKLPWALRQQEDAAAAVGGERNPTPAPPASGKSPARRIYGSPSQTQAARTTGSALRSTRARGRRAPHFQTPSVSAPRRQGARPCGSCAPRRNAAAESRLTPRPGAGSRSAPETHHGAPSPAPLSG